MQLNLEAKPVGSTTCRYIILWESEVRQDYKGGFHCLVDHVEWEIWCCTLGWEYKDGKSWGTWVAQSVKCLTLDFGSGHDLTVGEFGPVMGCVLTVRSLLGILCVSFSVSALPFLSLSPSLPLSLFLFLKNK